MRLLLAIALIVPSSAWAAEAPAYGPPTLPLSTDTSDESGEGDDGSEAPPGAAPDDHPEPLDLRLPINRGACPSLRACCVPGEELCYHPGLARPLLGAGGAAALGIGALAFLSFGDSLGVGDPYTGLMGGGVIAVGGAGLGALLSLFAPRGEGKVVDRPGRPTLRLQVAQRGTNTLDERRPYSMQLSADPTFEIGEHFQIQPHIGINFRLGTDADVDPREQHQVVDPDKDSTFPVVLESNRQRFSVGFEAAVFLPYPVLKPGKAQYTGPLEIRYRPEFQLRRRTLHTGDDAKRQVIRHAALYPATFGVRWHVSPRQRFTAYVGPRLDWIGFTDPGETELRSSPRPENGSFYAEAWYQLDVPFTPLHRKKTDVTGRLNIGYVHSNLDGQGINFSAALGFFGPVNVSWDFRFRRQNAPVAAQLTAGLWLGGGGGPYIEVGFVAPKMGGPLTKAKPSEEDS